MRGKKGRNPGRAPAPGSADAELNHPAEAQLRRMIAENRHRDALKQALVYARGHADTFERDGFVLDAFDALAHAFRAGILPAPSVREFFIAAARRLNAVEDIFVGAPDLHGRRAPRRKVKDPVRAVVKAIGFRELVKGPRAELNRSGDTRWTPRKIESAVNIYVYRALDPTTAVPARKVFLTETAKKFGVSERTVRRIYERRLREMEDGT